MELGAQLSNAQATISLLVAEKSSLGKQVADLNEQLDTLQDQSEATEQRLAEADALQHRQLDDVNARLKDLEAQLSSATQGQSDGQQREQRLSDEISDLKRKADLAGHAHEQTQGELASAQETIADLQTKVAANGTIADLESRLKAKSSHAETLEMEVSKLRQGAVKAKSDAEARDKALEESQARSTSVEGELKEARDAHEATKAQHGDVTAKHAELEQAHASLDTELHALRKEHSTAQADLSSAQTELAA